MGRRKEKQEEFQGEGFESKRDVEIETAADEYVEARNERMELSKTESAAKTKLSGLIHQRVKSVDGTFVYRNGEYEVEITAAKEKVKVRIGGDDSEDEENEE